MSSGASDQSLLMRYQRGDREAFRQLVKRYHVRAYNFVLRHANSALVADEVAPQVFVAVAVRAGQLSQQSRFAAYLFQEAHRRCNTLAERSKAPSEPAEGQPRDEAVFAAIDRLPAMQRDTFLLREVAQLCFPDIAFVLGQRESTVKIYMQGALRQLHRDLQRAPSAEGRFR